MMIAKSTKVSTRKPGKRSLLILGGLATLILTVVLGLMLTSGNTIEANAKEKPGKDPVKTLKVISVQSLQSVQGVNPHPTLVTPGHQLLAVTIDFDRDFKNHLRSSETGEVYLTDSKGNQTYYTVDTVLPTSEGPGHKPVHQVTFVFSVPQTTGTLILNYGGQYSVELPQTR